MIAIMLIFIIGVGIIEWLFRYLEK